MVLEQPNDIIPRGRPDKIIGENKSAPLLENLLSPDFAKNVYNAALATRLIKGEAIFYISNGKLSPVHSLNSRGYKKSTAETREFMSTYESIIEGYDNASLARAISIDLSNGMFGNLDVGALEDVDKGLEFDLHSHPGGHKKLYPSFQDLTSWEEQRYSRGSRKLSLEAILTVEGDEVRVLFMDFSGNIINYYQDEDRYRKAARTSDSMTQFLEQCGIRTHVLTMKMSQRQFTKEALRDFEAFLRNQTTTT